MGHARLLVGREPRDRPCRRGGGRDGPGRVRTRRTEGWPIESLAELDRELEGALLWGLELDRRYRVLAVTLELADDRAQTLVPAGEDRRVQLLCSPVSTVLASFRQVADGTAQLLTFTDEQLVDVAAAFGGQPLLAPRFGQPEPRPGEWAPQWSLEGRSSAPDGTARTISVGVRRIEGSERLELDLFARFDDVQVNAVDGATLAELRAHGGGDMLGLDLGLAPRDDA